jgi:RNA polymerase sigma-32 factor
MSGAGKKMPAEFGARPAKKSKQHGMYLGHIEESSKKYRFFSHENQTSDDEELRAERPPTASGAENKPQRLSAVDERSLVWRWQKRKDHRARDQLVRAFQPAIENLARRYRGRGLELQDTISIGNIGFLIALDKFDIKRRHRLWTCARQWVRAEISAATAKSHSVVHRPRLRGQKPSVQPDASLNAPNPGESLDRIHVLADDFPDYEPRYFDNEALNAALDSMAPRERAIFVARRLTDDPPTLARLALDFRVSAERVRQLEGAAAQIVSAKMKEAEAKPSGTFARQMTSQAFRGKGHKLTHSVFAWPGRDFPVAVFGVPKSRQNGGDK